MSSPSQAIVSESDTTARGPLVLLLVSAFGWLIVSTVLSLIGTIQLHTPTFLASCVAFTHGRVDAMQESAFIYGWAGNAAFAVSLWLLSVLGGTPLRGLGLLTTGAAFWNLGVTAGVVSIAAGEATSIPFLQMPGYIQPLLFVAAGAITTPAVLAWTGRSSDSTYASQWYAVAAIFLFPWLFSATQVMLLAAPVHGITHAIVANWFGQNVITLWLLPVAMAAAYYLVPKLTGRAAAHYEFAKLGFWSLIVFGAWTGGRHLIGGPAPVWVSTVAVVALYLLLFHYLVVAINLPAGLFAWNGSATLRFVAFGLTAYLVNGLADVITSTHAVSQLLHFTYFSVAQSKLLLGGAFSFLIFAAVYEMGPRISGAKWPAPGLIGTHFVVAASGTLVTVLGLAFAGWSQGHAQAETANNFAAVAAAAKPGLLIATAGEAILLGAAIIAFFHLVRLQLESFSTASSSRETPAPSAP
jgi:cytochrome c oxidase cbb3-type subunit 1